MARLDWQDICRHEPDVERLGEGDQINVNHPNCPAGHDTKKRLYVKRDNGDLIGWCHHCQSGGRKAGRANYVKRRSMNRTPTNVELPKDLRCAYKDMDLEARMWLKQYGITQQECLDNYIGWSAHHGRVILPVFYDHKLACYQQRRVLKNDKLPKYLTTRAKDIKYPIFRPRYTPPGKTVVFTEDILSAIKVNRQAPAASTLGTFLNPNSLAELVGREHFDTFAIWYDDDNHDVRKHQREAQKRCEMYGPAVIITGVGKDPKELNDADITQVLQRYRLL